MATIDLLPRPRESLPSILNLDFDKRQSEYGEQKFARIRGPEHAPLSTLSVGSPTLMYSGPPPPYSCAPAPATTSYDTAGYISPPQSTSRRSTRDDKDSPVGRTSLPSLSVALALKSGAETFSTSPSSIAPIGQLLGDAPTGPGNPFSQPATLATARKTSQTTGQTLIPSTSRVAPPPVLDCDRRASLTNLISSPAPLSRNPPPHPDTSTRDVKPERPTFRSPFAQEYSTTSFPFAEVHASQLPTSSRGAFTFEHNGKFDDSRNPFKAPPTTNYGDTVKRHMDIYEAELALTEVAQLSTRNLDIAQKWNHKYQQTNRTSYLSECLPDPPEIDDMIRQTHHVLDHLARLRDTSIMQQTLLQEQQARHARGAHHDDEYPTSHAYDSALFTGSEAKKRRGKAAPPGRCHSCNRAETPEWRRGPDGARTLCNACGLHYAKLTRKIGANKAASMTASSLRPKSLHDTRP